MRYPSCTLDANVKLSYTLYYVSEYDGLLTILYLKVSYTLCTLSECEVTLCIPCLNVKFHFVYHV
jgi:hypothetical protein